MIADALDDRERARIANGEALARDAAEIAFSRNGAVEHGVADDNGILRDDPRALRRTDDDSSARQSLTDIVVGIAREIEGNAVSEECAEALTRHAAQIDSDRIVGKASMTIALGNLSRQHGAHSSIDVADLVFDDDRRTLIKSRPGKLDEGTIKNALDVMLLRVCAALGRAARVFGFVEQFREIEAAGLPVLLSLGLVNELGCADDLIERAGAERGKDFSHFLRHEEEVVDNMLGLPLEALAQHGVLGGNTHRACVQVALAHHDAARGYEWGRGEAHLICAQQGGDNDVAAGAQASIDLDGDAI